MSDQQSIADRAIDAIAAVRAMDACVDLKHPERHIIRDLKREAEAVISDALRHARSLAYAAEELRKLHRAIEAEAASKETP